MDERYTAEVVIDSAGPDDLELYMKVLRDKFEGKAGNKALRERLGWTAEPDRYWQAHGRALDSGQIISGRGKGGSVRLASIELAVSTESDGTEADQEFARLTNTTNYTRETDLYPHALKVIESSWVKSANYDEHRSEITALKGSAPTGGKWTRPDISILATKAFPYLPFRLFDIITFEIKPVGQTTVEGVFEALSHQHFANRAYVIFHLTEIETAENFLDKQEGARILGIARKHGVGVIVATNIADWETWDELVPAQRCTPDPEQANRFIANAFSPKTLEQIIKWHK